MAGAVVLVAIGAGIVVGPADAAEPRHGRHYEMVTPADKLGQSTRPYGISPDGNIVQFSGLSGNGLPGSESQETILNPLLALRNERRWESFAMNLPWSLLRGQRRSVDATPGLGVLLSMGYNDADGARAYALYTRRPGQAPVRASVEFANRIGRISNPPQYSGGSADLKHVVISAPAGISADLESAFLSTDPPPWPNGYSPRKLYESVNSDPPILRRVDVDDAGAPIDPPDACFGRGDEDRQARLGSVSRMERALSADGRRIFFTVAPDCLTRRLFARVDGNSTIELSASECDRQADPGAVPPVPACELPSGDDVYGSASLDGRFVFFVSPNQLTNGDTDSAADLYRYDFDAPSGQRLTMLSEGDVPNPAPESEAGVQEVVRTSEDGRRVYFIATGVLTTDANDQGATATQGSNNLYVSDASDGGVQFVGALDQWGDWQFLGADSRPAQLADSTGRFFVFSSVAQLTVDDTDSTADVFRYDAGTDTLLRVSVGRDGFGSDGNSDLGATINPPNYSLVSQAGGVSKSRNVSADGRQVVFVTSEALEDGDTNEAPDGYEWLDGDVALVSGGKGDVGVDDSLLISADGGSVAFSTDQRLVPDRDTDTANDVYVARLGSDVDPLPPGPPAPCSGDACQGEASVLGAPAAPGSSGFSGGGNVVPEISARTGRVTVSRTGTILGSRARIKITVPGDGWLSASGRGVKTVKRTVAKRGSNHLNVGLSANARRTLQKRGRVRVSVRLVFMPAVGKATNVRLPLTFRSSSVRKGRS